MNSAATKEQLTNWSGNLAYKTNNVFYPTSLEEVQTIVKQCVQIKVLGSRHSFNEIADSNENLISLEKMNKVVSLDKTKNTVTVEAGMRYGELAPFLHENGYALHNLASLPHITIAGACATATHGSGSNNGNLSTAVTAIELVNAIGEIIHLSQQDDDFYGAVVGLGALGIVTKITLHLVPTFEMKQLVYLNMPMTALKNSFENIMATAYSVSLFTDWRNKNIVEVWIKSMAENDATPITQTFYEATLATRNMHPIANESAENVTQQMGVTGPWFERLPHFKMGFKPSAGKELQSEYFVAIEHAFDAMMALETLHEKITPHLFISEIRTVAADDLWMSPCYKKPCVAFHFTWKQEVEKVMALLPLVEERLAPFQAVPHWGKLFTMQPLVLQSRYNKLADFKQLTEKYDPNAKFRNVFLATNLYEVK